jgi:hypothetical protein
MLVKQDSEILFGLDITWRKGFEFVMFDFDIETTISLPAFSRITGIDIESFEACRAFLEKSILFSLNIS